MPLMSNGLAGVLRVMPARGLRLACFEPAAEFARVHHVHDVVEFAVFLLDWIPA